MIVLSSLFACIYLSSYHKTRKTCAITSQFSSCALSFSISRATSGIFIPLSPYSQSLLSLCQPPSALTRRYSLSGFLLSSSAESNRSLIGKGCLYPLFFKRFLKIIHLGVAGSHANGNHPPVQLRQRPLTGVTRYHMSADLLLPGRCSLEKLMAFS